VGTRLLFLAVTAELSQASLGTLTRAPSGSDEVAAKVWTLGPVAASGGDGSQA